MKKIMTALVVAALLTACGQSKEQQDLKQVLTEKFKDDSDLKDYKLKPEDIAECVVANISQDAPAIPGDPKRDRYFASFTKFAAANTVTDHIMSCMGLAIEKATPAE